MKEYKVIAFGKKGCDKCKVLNKRLDKLMEQDEWQAFEKEYYDITTVDGLVKFAEAECLNPQRIPALLVLQNTGDGSYEKIRQTFAEGYDDNGKYRLPAYVSLQTDYTEGGGVIKPAEIQAVLTEALAA